MTVAACVDEVLVRGLDDWIQAAEVASIARTHGGAKGDDEMRRTSLEVVEELLRGNLAQIGEVSGAGFQSWDLSQVAALTKVEADWRVGLNAPALGELFWLNLTEHGQRIAEDLWERTSPKKS